MTKGGMRNYPKFNKMKGGDKLGLPRSTAGKEARRQIPNLIDRR